MTNRVQPVWVEVENIKQPPSKWRFMIWTDEPGSSNFSNVSDRPIPLDRPCDSYAQLTMWLQTKGLNIPPLEYFMPTAEEIEDGQESVVRRVPPKD